MSKLREAAQAVVDHGPHRMTACSPLHWSNQSLEGDYLLNLYNAIERLADALAEDRLNEMQALAEDRLNEMQAAVLAEREACAAICDGNAKFWNDDLGYWGLAYSASAKSSAKKIRARGQE